MSVSSQLSRNTFLGNGSTNIYPITFQFSSSEDIKVFKRTAAGQVLLTGSDYSISDTNVVLAANLPNGESLVVVRDMKLTQETEYRNQGVLHLETIEDSLDKLTMITQQLAERTERSFSLSETTSNLFNPFLPPNIDASPLRTIMTNDTATGFVMGPTATEVGNAQTYAVNAKASEDAAKASELAAAASQAAAAASASAAASSQSSANASELAAAASELSAGMSESVALACRNQAEVFRDQSLSYKDLSETFKDQAQDARDQALVYRNEAEAFAAGVEEVKNSLIAESENNIQTGIAVLTEPTNLIVNLTGALTEIEGIVESVGQKVVILINQHTSAILLKNLKSGVAANRQIITGIEKDLSLKPKASVWILRDNSANKWRVVGGSGGSGQLGLSEVQTLNANGIISMISDSEQRVKIKSSGGDVKVLLPNGFSDGDKVFVQGDDDANPCTIANAGNVVSNGDITFTKYKLQLYIWDHANTKWVASGGY